jgi:eukaryotic-like serine/threonine-protein kinase
MPALQRAPRGFPPFEETLGRVILPQGSAPLAFDATIAQSSVDGASAQGGVGVPRLRGEVLEDLRIVSLLGEGGMGQVHLAEQRSLAREVALKTVHPGSAPSTVAALRQEALVTGQIEHPSVIPVHALGQSEDGRPVMVMKRIEGESWKELLASSRHSMWEAMSGERGLAANLEILAKVCHAVAFAHSRGIVHRDLKPENVMIGRFGEVYVVDWGLAVRVAEQTAGDGAPRPIVGTPAYMAPEMAAGFEVDERTDVYLLGAILHELLTGAPPHDGNTLVAVLAAAYASEPKAYGDGVPEDLATLCRDAMRQDPTSRPPSVRAFRDRLVGHLQHRASMAMARRGHERFETLAADDLASPEGRAGARRGLIECRFAFMQALDEWDGNRSAARGLRACDELGVRLDVADGHASAARAALEALGDPPAELVAAVEALEAGQARAREEAERLRQLAHDHDARVGGRTRRRAAIVIAGFCAVASMFVMRWRGDGGLEGWDTVRVAAFMAGTMGVLFLAFRRRLLRNAFSRKITYLAMFTTATMLGHRVLAALADHPPPVILSTDSLLFTVVLVTAGITLAPWLLVCAGFTFAGAVASTLDPARAPLWFSVSTILMVAAAAFFFRPEEGGSDGA